MKKVMLLTGAGQIGMAIDRRMGADCLRRNENRSGR